MPTIKTVIDPRLAEYATPVQLQYLELTNELGSMRKAALALCLGVNTVAQSLDRLKRIGVRHGISPEHDMTRPLPAGMSVKRISTNYKADGSVGQQWVIGEPDKAHQEELFRMFIETLSQEVRPIKKLPKLRKSDQVDDDLLCVFPIGDPHYGLRAWSDESGENFDLKTAEALTCSAIDRLVSVAPGAGTALLLNLGDMSHADSQSNTTKSGHQLDVDGRYIEIQQVGLYSMIHAVWRLLEKFPKVIFRINRGNHDDQSSHALAMMMSCYFRNESRVTVDLSPAKVWYFQFGENLVGSTHGDSIKGPAMPGVMAADVPAMWGATKHRTWYVGHVHHQDLKEYAGCVVEYFRTLAARDAWHAGQGYRAGRDMRCIVLHKEHGEIERHRCDVGMLQKAAA